MSAREVMMQWLKRQERGGIDPDPSQPLPVFVRFTRALGGLYSPSIMNVDEFTVYLHGGFYTVKSIYEPRFEARLSAVDRPEKKIRCVDRMTFELIEDIKRQREGLRV